MSDRTKAKTRTLIVWVTEGQHEQVRAAAKRNAITRAQLLRKCINVGWRQLTKDGVLK